MFFLFMLIDFDTCACFHEINDWQWRRQLIEIGGVNRKFQGGDQLRDDILVKKPRLHNCLEGTGSAYGNAPSNCKRLQYESMEICFCPSVFF